MEYEQFYKFLENRPVQELNNCIHRIVNMVGSRFTEPKPPHMSRNHTISSTDSHQLSTEAIRTDGIKKLVMRDGILLPHGMNGYHKTELRFIRWFPGYHGPVPNPNTFSLEHKLPTDWFLDKDLQVWLNWNADGYFEMSRKDSLKFNQNNSSNKSLVEEAHRINSSNAEKRKAESVTGSIDRKRSRSSDLPASIPGPPSAPAPRFKYLSSTSESEGNSENEKGDDETSMQMQDGTEDTQPTEQPSSEVTQQEAERELVRQNSTTTTTPTVPFTPPPTPTPSKPIKGDTVYITAGRYAGSEGTVMSGNEKGFRVQIPNIADPGSIIAQVPTEMVTLVRPTTGSSAAPATDPSETYLSALKRSAERPKQKPLSHPPVTLAAPSITASTTAKQKDHVEKKPPKTETRVQDNHEDSVDEFFNTLSGSDDDNFGDPVKNVPVVSESSNVTAKPKPSTAPHTTANVPIVSQSSEVSAESMVPKDGGMSEGSFLTESLTTPPDMVRDAETVSSVGLSLETENSDCAADGRKTVPASEPASEPASAQPDSASITPATSPKKQKHTIGRPKKQKDGSYRTAWSFKCKCSDVCSSYESSIYHPAGQWFECSRCNVWSHVQCLLGDVTIVQMQEMEELLCFSCKSKSRRKRSSRGQAVDAVESGDVPVHTPQVIKKSKEGVEGDAEQEAAAKEGATKVQPRLTAESPVNENSAPPASVAPENATTSATTTAAAMTTNATPVTTTITLAMTTTATAPTPSLTATPSAPSTTVATTSTEVCAESSNAESLISAATPLPERAPAAPAIGPVEPSEPVVTLPVKITTANRPVSPPEKTKPRSHKRKTHPTLSSLSPASRLLHVGQRVLLLRGQHRNEEAEIIDVARAGPVVLPDVYKVRLCSGSDKDKVLQMPLEFLTKKTASEQGSDFRAVQSDTSNAESSTEDRQYRPSSSVATTPAAADTPFASENTSGSLHSPQNPTPASAPEAINVSVSESAMDTEPAPVSPTPSELLQLSEAHSNANEMSSEEVQQALLMEKEEESQEGPTVASADGNGGAAPSAPLLHEDSTSTAAGSDGHMEEKAASATTPAQATDIAEPDQTAMVLSAE